MCIKLINLEKIYPILWSLIFMIDNNHIQRPSKIWKNNTQNLKKTKTIWNERNDLLRQTTPDTMNRVKHRRVEGTPFKNNVYACTHRDCRKRYFFQLESGGFADVVWRVLCVWTTRYKVLFLCIYVDLYVVRVVRLSHKPRHESERYARLIRVSYAFTNRVCKKRKGKVLISPFLYLIFDWQSTLNNVMPWKSWILIIVKKKNQNVYEKYETQTFWWPKVEKPIKQKKKAFFLALQRCRIGGNSRIFAGSNLHTLQRRRRRVLILHSLRRRRRSRRYTRTPRPAPPGTPPRSIRWRTNTAPSAVADASGFAFLLRAHTLANLKARTPLFDAAAGLDRTRRFPADPAARFIMGLRCRHIRQRREIRVR